jgi:hypothetical protein
VFQPAPTFVRPPNGAEALPVPLYNHSTPAPPRTDPLPFPPDLARLRVIETWCALLLDAVRGQIADLERRDRLAGDAAAGPVPVPEVEWLIQYGIGSRRTAMLVHTGDCRLTSGRTRPATREQAREALRQPGVEACGICAADRELGLEDP